MPDIFNILKDPLPEIDHEGNKYWHNDQNQLHRENDMPAIVLISGSKFWYKHGSLHRSNDQPAIVWHGGNKVWYVDGNFIK